MYAPEFHDQVISIWQNGGDLRSPVLEQLQQQRKFPHIVTCNRWTQQFVDKGHTCCKRLTGNCISQREVHRQDLVNLALYRMVHPKAYTDEVRAYVHSQNPANPPYSQSQVIRAEQRLGSVCSWPFLAMSERASLSSSTGATQREGLTCGNSSISCWSSAIGWMLIGPGGLSFLRWIT